MDNARGAARGDVMLDVKRMLAGLVIATSLAACQTPQAAHVGLQSSERPNMLSSPIGRNRYGLAAAWHQDESECGSAAPVRELLIRANGTYGVTWLPFETYQDYWGHWRYEPRTHTLTFTVDGGNYVPADRVDAGQVSVDAHTLMLGAISLGSPREGVRCTAVFRH
jgi:hypothetical protein